MNKRIRQNHNIFYLLFATVLLAGCTGGISDLETDGATPPNLPDLTQQVQSDTKDSSTNEVKSNDILDVEVDEDDESLNAYIMVHLEPNDAQTISSQWKLLEELVDLSGEYNIKLTLSFTPQWAQYILDNNEALLQLNSWEEEGYEVAVHHHGVSHVTWDGYTNAMPFKKRTDYKGDMNDLMSLVQSISTKQVLSGSMTDEDTDWPAGLLYRSYGNPKNKLQNLLSTPTKYIYNGQEVLELTKSAYMTGKPVDVKLSDIENAINSADIENEILGIALSDDSFSLSLIEGDIKELFELLDSYNVEVRSLSEILSE